MQTCYACLKYGRSNIRNKITVTAMLKRFAVENYRRFAGRVELDLSKVRNYAFHSEYIQGDLVSKCMMIGKNGCGKTNFGLALFDIVSVLTDFQTDINQKDAFGFLNGDSDLPYATFVYAFKFGQMEIEYEYRKTTPDTIVFESMHVDGNLIFSRNGDEYDLSGLDGIGAENLRVSMGDGSLSLLRYIANNTDQPKGSPIRAVMEFVNGMLYVRSVQDGNRYIGLTRGSEPIQDYIVRNGFTDDFHNVLKEMAGLDVDLGVLKMEGAPQRLVQKTKNKMLDFDQVSSSGTKLLMLHYYWMKHLDDVTFLYLDEFDAYYHYELAENVMLKISGRKDIQCMFTSHNTTLVSNRILRPDCYVCLDSRGIISLPDLTDREIREGHNLEKLLRGGEFDE